MSIIANGVASDDDLQVQAVGTITTFTSGTTVTVRDNGTTGDQRRRFAPRQ